MNGDANAPNTVVGERRPPGAAPLILKCMRGSASGRSFEVTPHGAVIGRAPECDITMHASTDGMVSGRHARITHEGGEWYFIDLGSTNGSLVDGQSARPNNPAALVDGAIIELGEDGSAGTVAFSVSIPGQERRPSAKSVQFACGSCQSPMSAPMAKVGHRVACPSCGVATEVPLSAPLFRGGSAGASASQAAPPPFPPPPGSGMPAFGTPQAGSPFSTHSESSEQNYLQQAAGLFGRVKKVYHNFKEKREVQEELARLESELASLTTPVRQAMLALGRAIWMSSPDDAIALDSGSGLQDASAAFESAQHDLDQAEGKLNEAKQQQADARAAWSERLRDAKKALEAVEQACRSAQSDAEAAKMGLRQSIEKCLKPVLEAANESKAIIARPLGAEPPIAEAVLTVSEAAENAARVVRETIAELAEPEAACRGAVSRAAAAKADLEQAQRDMAGLQKESNESEVSLTNRIKENESRVASVRAQVRAAKEKLDEYCVRVGRAAVDSGNSGLLAAGGAAAANATSLSRRDFDLRCRIDELRSRLADLQ